ncbi:MAG: NTE family protein [Luteibaculaceae bacterium]|jgi:NTE family protein
MKAISIFLFVAFFANLIHAQSYENLVFEGAGIRGIAYSGVIKELEKKNIIKDVVKVGGTSAGAITALMVSLGYTSNEISEIISETKFEAFNDGEFFFIGGFSRLNSKFGWYKGEKFTKWIAEIIGAKTGDSEITFGELKQAGFKQLYITATCLNKQKLIVFSADTYPKMKIKDAARISMSIPLYFEAVFIDSIGCVHKDNDVDNLDVVVDGGILGNFPIFIFDGHQVDSSNQQIRVPNQKTLGIRIDSDSQIKNDAFSKELVSIPISNMNTYLEAFYVLILENLNRIPLIPEDWERTISVSSVGISPRIKKLSTEQKESLIQSGEISTRRYFEKIEAEADN